MAGMRVTLILALLTVAYAQNDRIPDCEQDNTIVSTGPVNIGEAVDFLLCTPDDSITGVTWYFGDSSSTVGGVTAEHAFSTPGRHPVTATSTANPAKAEGVVAVLDCAGADVDSGDIVVTGKVAGRLSVISACTKESTSTEFGLYTWTISDDNSDQTSDYAGMVIEHTFVEAGTYTITVSIQDDSISYSNSLTSTVTISDESSYSTDGHSGSECTIKTSPSSGVVDTSKDIKFSLCSDTEKVTWNYGDDSDLDVKLEGKHKYSKPGVYRVYADITEEDDEQYLTWVSIGVSDCGSETNGIVFSGTKKPGHEIVMMLCLDSVPTSSVIWHTGTEADENSELLSYVPSIATFTYDEPGKYTVTANHKGDEYKKSITIAGSVSPSETGSHSTGSFSTFSRSTGLDSTDSSTRDHGSSSSGGGGGGRKGHGFAFVFILIVVLLATVVVFALIFILVRSRRPSPKQRQLQTPLQEAPTPAEYKALNEAGPAEEI